MRRWASTLVGALLFVGIPVGIAHAISASGPSGQGTVFLPVGNGYVDGCNVERIYVTPAKPAPPAPPGGVTYPTPELTWVLLDSGKAVSLPEGTDPTFVAQEIANNDCR